MHIYTKTLTLSLAITLLGAPAFADSDFSDPAVYGSDCESPNDPMCGDFDLELRACYKEILRAKSIKTEESFVKLAECQKKNVETAQNILTCVGNSDKTKELTLLVDLDQRNFYYGDGKDLSIAGELNACDKPTRSKKGQHLMACSAGRIQVGSLQLGTQMEKAARLGLVATESYGVSTKSFILNVGNTVKGLQLKCSAKGEAPLQDIFTK